MNKFILKNKLLATTVICAISMCANIVKAEYIPTNGDNSAYTVTKVTENNDYDFRWYTGLDENNNPTFEYYTYAVKDVIPNQASERLDITGDINTVNNNFVGIQNKESEGGAIYNINGTVSDIVGDFVGNATITYKAEGGAIYSKYDFATVNNIKGDFIANRAISDIGVAEGGALNTQDNNDDRIDHITITGNFIGNYTETQNNYAQGGGIHNIRSHFYAITGDFVENYSKSEDYAARGGGVYNHGGLINTLTGNFIGNYVYGGQIAQGGAIYNTYSGSIGMLADNRNILFYGNYVNDHDGKRYEAIYNMEKVSYGAPDMKGDNIIDFQTQNNGSYTFYDYITNNSILKITGDGTGTFNLYNDIKGQGTVNFQAKYVLNMISPDDIHQDVFTSKYSYIQAQNVNINAALQMMLDVDLEAKEMDRFEAENFTIADGGSIDVVQLNIVKDLTVEPTEKIEVPFIVIDDISKATGLDKISTNITEVIGTNYTYSVTFNPETGAFEFVAAKGPAPEEVAPNQAPVLTTNTTVAAVETVVAQIFERDVTISTDINYGSDTPYSSERVSEEATSDGVNVHNNKSVWVKTFGSDDDLDLDNFNGTIDSEAYGIVGGVDSKVFKYDNGVKAAYGVYGAYVGGKQKHDGNKTTQDSGYLGVSASFRKNNLFSNFTLNGGYITSEANTAWGTDKFDTKTISVANKTGVDIKVGNSWTFTPALYVAYTGLDTEDYTNKAGVKMENEFTHVVTLAPEVTLGRYFGKGFSGYAKASYKHYIYDTEVKADDVVLEEMSAKPYVEYGFGVEKNWADKSGYAELTRRDGGREGWNVNLGLNLDF